nr:YeeE/YedE thiosulfate transporter family protein [uncultured Pedobacter sp.]
MLEIIKQPWSWYIAGVLIGLTVPALLLIGNKSFGVSSSLKHICAACLPAKIPFFSYNWKKEIWNLFFVTGILVGGYIATTFLSTGEPVQIAESTKEQLTALGVKDFSGLMPSDIFGTAQIFSLKGLIFLVFGGFMVGFGTRYADGCTSGHSIMGLSNLQWPSLVATICFMLGGFISTWVLLPFIFKLIA